MKLCFLSGLKEIVGQEELEIEYSGRLSGLLEILCDRYGEGLGRLLLDSGPPARKSLFVKVLVDGEDVRQEDPELTGNETVFLFLPIAGG